MHVIAQSSPSVLTGSLGVGTSFLWCTHLWVKHQHSKVEKTNFPLHLRINSVMWLSGISVLTWVQIAPPPFLLSQFYPVFPSVLFPSLLSGFPGHLWVLQYATLMSQHYLHTTCVSASQHCVCVSERVCILGLTASGSPDTQQIRLCYSVLAAEFRCGYCPGSNGDRHQSCFPLFVCTIYEVTCAKTKEIN